MKKPSIQRWLCVGLLWVSACALAQVPERTIEEIKQESMLRAKRGAYPLGGLDPQDVEQALQAIKTRDRDEWAAGWEIGRAHV